MPAHPKLPEDHWADARARWESDPRKGYAWLVADLGLPVTGAAVRNKALKECWIKNVPTEAPRLKTSAPRCCCGCCGNHGHDKKCEGRRGNIPQSEVLERLASALETVGECVRVLREKP